MNKDQVNKLIDDVQNVTAKFEAERWTENIKALKEGFNVTEINTPNHYWELMRELNEISRETRIMFLYSVFNKVCKEDGVPYRFYSPFEAGMKYTAVIKLDNGFYILDEGGQSRDIFTTKKFICFIDNEYRDLIDGE